MRSAAPSFSRGRCCRKLVSQKMQAQNWPFCVCCTLYVLRRRPAARNRAALHITAFYCDTYIQSNRSMSDFGSVVAHVIGLPKGTSLGDLEGLILPRINGRIVAIGLQDEGTANIEFARMADAGARAPGTPCAPACLPVLPHTPLTRRVLPSSLCAKTEQTHAHGDHKLKGATSRSSCRRTRRRRR